MPPNLYSEYAMQNNVTIKIRPFGGLRQYAPEEYWCLSVPRGSTLAELRQQLLQAITTHYPGFDQPKLLEASAFADERAVLPNHYRCTEDASLALLPPVSGG